MAVEPILAWEPGGPLTNAELCECFEIECFIQESGNMSRVFQHPHRSHLVLICTGRRRINIDLVRCCYYCVDLAKGTPQHGWNFNERRSYDA